MLPKVFALFLLSAFLIVACVKVQPPTDTGDPVQASPVAPTAPTTPTTPTTPTGPTDPNAGGSTTTQPAGLAYDPDLKPIFSTDCFACHGGNTSDGGYRMNTYAQVMTAVRAGSASSSLVVTTQSNGRMYRYFSGSTATRQAKAAEVLSWVVTYKAQETR